jgi:hypothetical protein
VCASDQGFPYWVTEGDPVCKRRFFDLGQADLYALT